ncbi:hypothetical protein V9803_004192 [Vibrio vulnificus]
MKSTNRNGFSRDVLIGLTSICIWALGVVYGFLYFTRDVLTDESTLKVIEPLKYAFTVSIICLLVFSWAIHYSRKIPSDIFNNFLALPDKDTKFTFPVLSTFLGEQAFSSLIATILITFSKTIYEISNAWGSGIYIAVIALFMFTFSAFSLIRFIITFTSMKGWHYAVASTFSTVLMFLLIFSGLHMRTT